MPMITAAISAVLAAAVVLLMKKETNKKVGSVPPEEIDTIVGKPYKGTVGAWILFAAVVLLSAFTGYRVALRANGVTAIVKLMICYLAVLAAAVIDLRTRTIPNVIPVSLVVIRLGLFVFELLSEEAALGYLLSSVLGCLACGIVLVIANKLSKGGIGAGDIKLLSCIGFMCGLYVVLSAILLALVCCIVFSGAMIALRRWSAKNQVPFGPFIYMGYAAMCLLTLY